jgi:hypothetical protein
VWLLSGWDCPENRSMTSTRSWRDGQGAAALGRLNAFSSRVRSLARVMCGAAGTPTPCSAPPWLWNKTIIIVFTSYFRILLRGSQWLACVPDAHALCPLVSLGMSYHWVCLAGIRRPSQIHILNRGSIPFTPAPSYCTVHMNAGPLERPRRGPVWERHVHRARAAVAARSQAGRRRQRSGRTPRPLRDRLGGAGR